jgi:hypothetical protein
MRLTIAVAPVEGMDPGTACMRRHAIFSESNVRAGLSQAQSSSPRLCTSPTHA